MIEIRGDKKVLVTPVSKEDLADIKIGDIVWLDGDLMTCRDVALRHLEMLIEYKNESVAVKEMRRHIGAYLKGMPKAAEYRGRFHQTETYADFKKLLAEYIEVAEKFGA